LSREPLCRHCSARGLIVAAVLVDHIQPLMQGGTHAVENLQPLCVQCHAVKTAEDQRRIRAPDAGTG
jgi:5-methylcytosine-specific restriction protein A